MVLCPLMKEECRTECAWFRDEGCAVAKLRNITDHLENVSVAVKLLQNTINHTNDCKGY